MIADKLLGSIQLPDKIYRRAIKRLLRIKLNNEKETYKTQTIQDYANTLKKQEIAIMTQEANDQHYEVPISFFEHVMGSHKKYSSCIFENNNSNLSKAEYDMLELTCKRAELDNGQHILELGCGWGSLSLFMAQKYPSSNITVMSNSTSQKAYIDEQIKKKQLQNITVITANIATLELNKQFDRIISIEMFEHVRNYELLFKKISQWLNKNGQLFIHVFGHKHYAYPFEDNEQKSWITRHFFSGGQMPSLDLFEQFNKDLNVTKKWIISGNHYAKTCKKWLENMDSNKSHIIPIFKNTYGHKTKQFWIYWRLFFMACEELFKFNNGEEWQVYHYLLHKC